MGKAVYLMVGGITGTYARYWLAGAIYQKLGTSFPYGTMIVNLTGCFLIGFFSAMIDDKFFLGPDSKVLLMTGFCGAYTTFSTLILETSNLAQEGEITRALLNVIGSLIIGFIALRLGIMIGKLI